MIFAAAGAVVDLAGWRDDDHAAAFAAFHRSAARLIAAPPAVSPFNPAEPAAWVAVARAALARPESLEHDAARAFFERHFVAHPIVSRETSPFLTGYFEPEFLGTRVPSPRYPVPLLARPPDLIDISEANRPPDWPENCPFARLSDAGPTTYHTRAAIMAGALAGRGLELVYLADAVDAFYAHVQGSCRIRLVDGPEAGAILRLGYAGRNGLPYTSIGRLLIERGVFSAAMMSGTTLATWLRAHPDEGVALMCENESYVFFRAMSDLDPQRGPLGAAAVQLTAGRSLAIDHRQHGYGVPIWIDATLPLGDDGASTPFRRLLVAQDTGSAIVGPARGDIFLGSGPDAGVRAGRLRHQADGFVVLIPTTNATGDE